MADTRFSALTLINIDRFVKTNTVDVYSRPAVSTNYCRFI